MIEPATRSDRERVIGRLPWRDGSRCPTRGRHREILSGAGERYRLWTTGGVVGNCQDSGSAARSCRVEKDSDCATGARRNATAVGVQHAKVARAGSRTSDGESKCACVGERYSLEGQTYLHIDWEMRSLL